MKKLLLSIFLLMIGITIRVSAQRYTSEVFTDVNVTHNVVYGTNYSMLLKYTQGGPIFLDSLKADIYEPVGDSMPNRPTIFLAHPGAAMPIFYNYNCVGDKTDSSIAEQCRQFARRGYTAIAYNYRLGWNPISPNQDIRSGSLLQAAGRAVQDQKACVRYFRNNAMNANSYHIDPNKLILGGNGTGGTFTFAYATIHNYADINLFKFLSANDDTIFHFTNGVTYFDSTYWGSVDGYGGHPSLNNSNNTPGVSNVIHFVFGEEGLVPDSSWMKAGDVPMVAFQDKQDTLDPWYCGPVYNYAGYITTVCGGRVIIDEANSFNNNSTFQNNTWNDAYTVQARSVNGNNPNLDGLFPFVTPDDEQAPWEWYDSTTCFMGMINGMGFTIGHADSVWYNALSSNPHMSKANAMHYIDTIMGYLNPRIVAALNLNVSVNEISLLERSVSVYPNPTTDRFTVKVGDPTKNVSSIDLYDISGREVRHIANPVGSLISIDRNGLESGIYFVKLKFALGDVVKKITLQ